jgi:hypothetical protein
LGYAATVNRPLLAGVLAIAALTVACKPKQEQYESVCQIVSRETVEADDKGGPLMIDLELEWDPCPGDQFQMVRGGKDFAACMAKYEVGDFVPVRVQHRWDTRGYYTWDVFQVGDCQRPIEEESEGSYEKSQECRDDQSYGHPQGFYCSRRPFKNLVSVCPFMARN